MSATAVRILETRSREWGPDLRSGHQLVELGGAARPAEAGIPGGGSPALRATSQGRVKDAVRYMGRGCEVLEVEAPLCAFSVYRLVTGVKGIGLGFAVVAPAVAYATFLAGAPRTESAGKPRPKKPQTLDTGACGRFAARQQRESEERRRG